ncbi:MAG: glycoside hydrolase family 13 protein [Bacteroidota bacterium]
MPRHLVFLLLLFMLSCRNTEQDEPSVDTFSKPPAWAAEAVWYQIFVERFRNGDPENDPRLVDVQPGFIDTFPDTWSITPWNWDWYQAEDWMADIKRREALPPEHFDRFSRGLQMRRFGGDLQGVLEKVDYLKELGINAIYFNPLNDAPSLHKFDARHYRHIDRNFGPDPAGDVEIMGRENPADPDSWQWTAADRLFLELIDSLHRNDIRLIVDFSWNHTGADYWAFNDVRENGANSEFADWYEIEQFDNPNTPENEFEYRGWFGVESLPELAEENEPLPGFDYEEGDIYPLTGGFESESLKAHIFAVAERWLDPNGDGDPSDGIDGFRLDVAAEVGMDFWRDFRRSVRSVNPEAYLVGEVWWQRWPDKLIDPSAYLQGDIFDAVMNYRWYKMSRGAIAGRPPLIAAREFGPYWDSLQQGFDPAFAMAMMNVASSHDSPRLATSLANEFPYKAGQGPRGNPNYEASQPTRDVWLKRQLPLLVQQFTWVGAPQIYYGEEAGLWGADDPDCRKPMLWPEDGSRVEYTHPDGLSQEPDTLNWTSKYVRERYEAYQQLIDLRKFNPVLIYGDVGYPDEYDRQLVAYTRFNESKTYLCLFNTSNEEIVQTIPTEFSYLFSTDFFEYGFGSNHALVDGNTYRLDPGDFLIMSKSN